MADERNDATKFAVAPSRIRLLFVAALVVIAVVEAWPSGLARYGASTPASRAAAEIAAGAFPAYTPLTGGFVLSILPWLALATVLSVVVVRLARVAGDAVSRMRVVRPESESLAVGEGGEAVIEFLLVLPFLLMICLTILQVSLIVQAKFVVNYAAFCAVRSAIVWIPAKNDDEARNELGNPDTSKKVDAVRRAAALPCTAVSPGKSVAGDTNLALSDSEVDQALTDTYNLFDVAADTKIRESFLSKAQYAFDRENTKVTISPPAGGDTYGEHEEITVTVVHRFYLVFPFMGTLFGTKFPGGRASFANITEQYTLLNDGEPYDPDGKYDEE